MEAERRYCSGGTIIVIYHLDSARGAVLSLSLHPHLPSDLLSQARSKYKSREAEPADP